MRPIDGGEPSGEAGGFQRSGSISEIEGYSLGQSGQAREVVGLAPGAKVGPIRMVCPEGITGLGSGREFLGLSAERGEDGFVG
jgi:hypothetical protein